MSLIVKTLLLALLPALNQVIDYAQSEIDPGDSWKEEIDGIQQVLNAFLKKLLD